MRPEIDSPIGKLQQRFVRLRITNMAEVDVGLFDFDFDTTFALFVINADRQVYLRYGARTDESAEAMLSTNSLRLALNRALEMHEEHRAGRIELPPAPKPLPAQSFPNVRKVVQKNQCVHCHQVGEGRAIELIAKPEFDKKTMPWVYPDPATLGLHLDPDIGIRLAETSGSAAAAGLPAGESIMRIGERRVSTFADVQYALHQLPVGAESLSVTTDRRKREISLPPHWRVTNINRRSIGHKMTPFPEFWGKALSRDEKSRRNLAPQGFATRVTKFWTDTNGKRAGLREGDIVFEVNGKRQSPLAQNAMIYIRTHFTTGDEIRVRYLRDRKAQETNFKLRAKPW